MVKIIRVPMQETLLWSLVGKSPWRRKWQPTPVFLPGKSHEQRSLAAYSAQDPIESAMTAPKQQQQNVFFRHLKGQPCTCLECTHPILEMTALSCLMKTVTPHGHQGITRFMFFPRPLFFPLETQALTACFFLFFTILNMRLELIAWT